MDQGDSGAMGATQLQQWLPHRAPFLLVDCVTELVPGSHIVARKCLTVSDPVFEGHFPGHPVYPGVLIVEALAQVGTILGCVTLSEGDPGQRFDVKLAEISRARFRRPAEPGDVLSLRSEMVRRRGHFFWFRNEAFCERSQVCTVDLLAMLAPVRPGFPSTEVGRE